MSFKTDIHVSRHIITQKLDVTIQKKKKSDVEIGCINLVPPDFKSKMVYSVSKIDLTHYEYHDAFNESQ